MSPLAAAARAGDLVEIDRLLAAGADINAGSGVNNWPPVIHAVHKGQVKALEHLLDRGAVADQPVRDRALDVARGSGDEAEVRAILAAFPVRTDQPQPLTLGRPRDPRNCGRCTAGVFFSACRPVPCNL